MHVFSILCSVSLMTTVHYLSVFTYSLLWCCPILVTRNTCSVHVLCIVNENYFTVDSNYIYVITYKIL